MQLENRRDRLQKGINKLDGAVHQIGQLSIMVEEHRKNVSAAAVKYDEILHRISESKSLFLFYCGWIFLPALTMLPPSIPIYEFDMQRIIESRRRGKELWRRG